MKVDRQSPNGRSQWEQLLANRRAILLLLFCATGVLGLPLLWLSPAFSARERVLWSVVNTLYTLALFAMVVGVCYWCYLQFQNAGLI